MATYANKIAEGKKFLKQGQKLAKGGFFSKKNPDEAEKAYELAKKKFRFIKPPTAESVTLYLETLDCIAEAREDMNLNNSAAQAMEEAARACQSASDKKLDQFTKQMPMFLQKAAHYYRLNNQFDLASKNLVKAAEELNDLDESFKLLDLACDIQEEENRFMTCHEYYDAALRYAIKHQRYKQANQFLDRQNKMYANEAEKFLKRIWRNITSKMIIEFHLKQVKEAQSVYYEGLETYQKYGDCPEQKLCDEFIQVFMAADLEGLIKIQKSGTLGMLLTNTMARMGAKLNMIDIKSLVVEEEEMKQKEDEEHKENIEEAQEAVDDTQLKSDIQDVEVDDDGAPNLMDIE